MDLHHPLSLVTPTVDGDVLAVLAGAEASFTAPEVHRLIGEHSESGVRKSLKRLSGEGIVAATRKGHAWSYELNRSHLAAGSVIALARLRAKVLECISAELDRWEIRAEYAALFGSAATGGMRSDSDIDLFVVRPDAIGFDDDTWRHQLDELSSALTAWTGNDTRILELSAEEVAGGLRDNSEAILGDVRDDALWLSGPTSYLRRARQER